jgi:hypothetical protein
MQVFSTSFTTHPTPYPPDYLRQLLALYAINGIKVVWPDTGLLDNSSFWQLAGFSKPDSPVLSKDAMQLLQTGVVELAVREGITSIREFQEQRKSSRILPPSIAPDNFVQAVDDLNLTGNSLNWSVKTVAETFRSNVLKVAESKIDSANQLISDSSRQCLRRYIEAVDQSQTPVMFADIFKMVTDPDNFLLIPISETEKTVLIRDKNAIINICEENYIHNVGMSLGLKSEQLAKPFGNSDISSFTLAGDDDLRLKVELASELQNEISRSPYSVDIPSWYFNRDFLSNVPFTGLIEILQKDPNVASARQRLGELHDELMSFVGLGSPSDKTIARLSDLPAELLDWYNTYLFLVDKALRESGHLADRHRSTIRINWDAVADTGLAGIGLAVSDLNSVPSWMVFGTAMTFVFVRTANSKLRPISPKTDRSIVRTATSTG